MASEVDIKTNGNLTKQAFVALIQVAIRNGGFAPYKLAVIVANAVARALLNRGLSLAVNAGLTRTIGILSGPIGWALTTIWAISDIAGPAYRVTIPACVHIAYLRIKNSQLTYSALSV